MITYVDTSTLIKLLVAEPGSDRAREVWDASDRLATVVLTAVEGAATLAAGERCGRITGEQAEHLLVTCRGLLTQMSIVAVTSELVDQAAVLAKAQALRGYNAVHLAAALSIGADVLTSADRALCVAASRCGLHVADPLQALVRDRADGSCGGGTSPTSWRRLMRPCGRSPSSARAHRVARSARGDAGLVPDRVVGLIDPAVGAEDDEAVQ